MPDTPETPSKAATAFSRLRDSTARTASRAWSAIRRHPWRTAFALPALLVLYVAAIYPFTPSIGDIRKAKQEQPTLVMSADGKELAVFKRANRDWVKLADISPHVRDALLATEDHRFYEHAGLDVKRTARAAVNTLLGDRQGGSTITQQLARNLYPDEVGRAPTIHRKVKELITAFKIEAVYSKDEILETYLNTVPFLFNAFGIEMAAQTYFDKPAKQLDVAESATLVGMLKGTSMYNPVMNPERAVQRRNTVLAQMVKHGKLPQARFETLARSPLKLDFERQPEFGGPAAHVAQSIRRWLIGWADRNDYNIHADGLVVRTTIDSRLQAMANEAVKRQGDLVQAVADVEWGRAAGSLSTNPETYEAQKGRVEAFSHFWASQKGTVDTMLRETPQYRAARDAGQDDAAALAQLKDDDDFMKAFKREKTRVQAGFLAVDPANGHVKAWVGSRDYQQDKFDHVQQARRQPGSTFKPFVYGAAFESGARPTDTYVDQPVEIRIDKTQVWRPGDVGDYTGAPMTLRDGLVKSKNAITAQVMQQVGPGRVASLARAMGVRTSPLEQVPSLALGTSPVTLREMVASYATIANMGNYIEPIVVTAVEDRNGNVLESFSAPAPERAISNEAAQTLLDILRGVISEGTAVGLRHRFGINGDVAGKTGTTQRNTDGWFVLMHPQLVAGAWMGFNDNRVTMRSEYWGQGAHNALFVVGDFMKQSFAAKRLDAKATFAVPKDSSKGLPQDPSLWGRVNDWWSSMFPGATVATEQAAVVQPTPVPPMTEPPPLPEPPVAEPLQLPDSGVLPPSRTNETVVSTPRAAGEAVVGAPAPRTPDAVIAAPPATQPAWPNAPVVIAPAARPGERTVVTVPGGRARLPQASPAVVDPAPADTTSATGSARAAPREPRESVTLSTSASPAATTASPSAATASAPSPRATVSTAPSSASTPSTALGAGPAGIPVPAQASGEASAPDTTSNPSSAGGSSSVGESNEPRSVPAEPAVQPSVGSATGSATE